MPVYVYDDTYITNSVDPAALERVEANALIDLGKQNVTDTYYLEQMTKCLVYIALATKQLEAEGMNERVNQYRKEYDRFSQMNSFEGTDRGAFSGTIGRA
jgi:hypothetical protein